MSPELNAAPRSHAGQHLRVVVQGTDVAVSSDFGHLHPHAFGCDAPGSGVDHLEEEFRQVAWLEVLPLVTARDVKGVGVLSIERLPIAESVSDCRRLPAEQSHVHDPCTTSGHRPKRMS